MTAPRWDLIVVGGGVAGATLAAEAAARGLRVALASRGFMDAASAAAAGIVTVQLPRPHLGWAIESAAYYHRRGVSRPVNAILAAPGECVGSMLEELAASGVPARRLGPREASRLAGIPLEPPEGHALASTLDSLVDLGALRAYMAVELARLGVEVVECTVTRAWADAVQCGEGIVMEAADVVVAAGAWAPRITGLPPEAVAGGTIYNCEASSVELPGLRAVIYVEAGGGSAYATPESPSRAIAGDGPNTPLEDPDNAAPQPGTPYEVLEALAQATPAALHAAPLASWAAPCLVTGDGMPALGRASRRTPIIYTGLDGYGLMAAPALSRRLADHIARGTPLPPGLDPARPAEPWRGRGPPPEPYRQC